MTDLISRAAAIESLGERPYNWTDSESEISEVCAWENHKSAIENIPSVDAVQVVRCADCRYCFDIGCDPMEPYDGESEWYCERWDRETSAYVTDPYRFYCADGERRDDEER